MAKTPEIIQQLVENFERNIESFKGAGYNETQARREFIDPFFETLGWDIQNKSGTAAAYKDVIHEDTIKVGSSTKAPDYGFRIGGTKKFYLEAKKPAVNISTDISPAYQLRRYAWSAKLPLSILTDFEEFSVYDCQIRPNVSDKASTARIFHCTYKDYFEKWEYISNIFSKEAVLKGLFDKYASEKTAKKGTTTVDREILGEIERWRESLAKNIALRNSKLSVYDLNFAVQKTIDRILFLRICEDRGIEYSNQLLGLVNGDKIYPRLFSLFERADEKYNSGIFHFHSDKERPEGPDELSSKLKIDDDILKEILRDLYYPRSPYEFSVMPAEILGNVYEQFLGKVIRLTASHQARVEEKPEVKKAGGVYYTPSYIVDYIVKNTVGKLCEGKTPKQVEKIKILDPACGSGSFLIGAYQYLLDWHRDFYVDGEKGEKGAKSGKGKIYQGKGGQWFLTIDEKKRILLNNIYGVDIDSQAVEVTKLSLLLKVLENETQESLRLFHERALPDLGDNIKCGNSLIGPDFYNNQQMSLGFDDEQERKINAFYWKKEFPEILGGKNPGFDCVIGNPPYVFGRDWKSLKISDDVKVYLSVHYKTSPYQMDMFSIFMEKAFNLIKIGGYIGQIVPNVWLTNTYSSVTRAFFFSHSQNICIAIPPSNVFQGITVDTVVYSFMKSSQPSKSFKIVSIDKGTKESNLIELNTLKYIDGVKPISTAISAEASDFIESLKRKCVELGSLANITRGVHPYRIGGFGRTAYGSGPQIQKDLENRPYHSQTFKKGFRPFIYGCDLKRYGSVIPQEYINYGDWLAEPRSHYFFEGDRIYSRKILADRLLVTFENGNSVADQQVYITKSDNKICPKYLLGIMGSHLIAFFIRTYFDEATKAFPQIKVTQLKMIPIKTIDFKNPSDKNQHDKMVGLVERMLELNKKVNELKNPQEKERVQRQIEMTDCEIDKLVYELYGLTEDEIKIVEGSSD
jgi:type I restriction-modification system DNA methylase subunit